MPPPSLLAPEKTVPITTTLFSWRATLPSPQNQWYKCPVEELNLTHSKNRKNIGVPVGSIQVITLSAILGGWPEAKNNAFSFQ